MLVNSVDCFCGNIWGNNLFTSIWNIAWTVLSIVWIHAVLFEIVVWNNLKKRVAIIFIWIRRTGYMSSVNFQNESCYHCIFFVVSFILLAMVDVLKSSSYLPEIFQYNDNNQIGKDYFFQKSSILFLQRLSSP